ncbi:hypothetical protein [Nostoc sp. PCC 7107]|uniref:hypothetical protein n=1 Tax=Nostoc sp. PCC 7107 TaxID=317936 RepID=UPI00031D7D3F|nr:hypothetical protein [Nostoc sp. PCC 7107]
MMTPTLLLQYSLGEQRSYLWMVSKTSISSYELPKRADIEILVKQFNYLLKISSYSPRAKREIGAESCLMTFRSVEVILNTMIFCIWMIVYFRF